MPKHVWNCLFGGALAAVLTGAAVADDHFAIVSFQVTGNTLLKPAAVQKAVSPMTGPDRVYGDVQRALEALELAYRKAGFTAVQVYVPEQELTGGVVRIQVTEAKVARITVKGNHHFSDANIRASLPRLQVGQTPNFSEVSQSIQLANESPAKQVAVQLEATGEEGKVNADVSVQETPPLRAFVTLDNTGAPATGLWRTGVALQYANMFGVDQVGTLSYTTSPDSPHGVDVDLYSLGYRIPLYQIGDSVDFVYGKSNVNTPSASPTLGGVLGLTGKGDIFGLRWNHIFARRGEYTSRLVFGFDDKKIDSRCQVDGVDVSTAPPTPPISSCVPYKTRPFSATYSGQKQSVEQLFDYSLGVSRNWATGTRYTNLTGRTDRYSYLTSGNRDTVDGFVTVNSTASLLRSFAGDWQVRLAGTAQYSQHPLVNSEQLGLTGASLVRGFIERDVVTDSGVLANLEVYTPELAGRNRLPGNLRLLAFYDIGRGFNSHVGSSGVPDSVSVSSVGAGARYAFGRYLTLRLDAAHVNQSGTSSLEERGDWRAHLSVTAGY